MREFLRGLELDEETVDTIMAEYGKNVTKLKEQISDYDDKFKDYETQVKDLNTKLEANSKDLENYQNVTNENKNLKAQLQMSNANVKKEFTKFVTSEVLSQVDDKHDFQSVLDDYKKENPQYFGSSVVNKVQTSPNLNGGNTNEPQTTNRIMNDLLRSAKDD